MNQQTRGSALRKPQRETALTQIDMILQICRFRFPLAFKKVRIRPLESPAETNFKAKIIAVTRNVAQFAVLILSHERKFIRHTVFKRKDLRLITVCRINFLSWLSLSTA